MVEIVLLFLGLIQRGWWTENYDITYVLVLYTCKYIYIEGVASSIKHNFQSFKATELVQLSAESIFQAGFNQL